MRYMIRRRIDEAIINRLSGDLPESTKPFEDIAHELGISQSDLLSRVKLMQKKSVIRRFGATLNHRRAGVTSNAMAVWNVPNARVSSAGKLMSSFPDITHCYQRRRRGDWKYNMYAMIHGQTRKQCAKIAKEISGKTGIKDYKLLFSTREFKKTSMRYF
jgi:DNA-binding Lrp family transcriptional regulator